MEDKDFCCYEFGEFRLDARRRSLSKNGEKVPLPARNYDLLLFMVENGGRILEHEELLDKVWAGTFVEQATLKKGVSALRQILQEKPETEFIKTIPRRGYSFVSPVRVVPQENEFSYVRETEREIIIEEYEETDETEEDFHVAEKIIEIPSASLKASPSAETKKISLSRTVISIGAGIFTLILIFFALKPYLSKNVEPQFSAENVRVSRLTNNGKVISGTTVSPDGTYILYPAAEKDGTSLWLRQVLANSATRLTPPINGGFWAFGSAPDNSYVYYILNNISEPQKTGLYKIPLLGGDPQRIAENVGSFAISPDGTRITLVRSLNGETTVSIVNNKGEDEHAVTSFQSNYRLWNVLWTPDGTTLLCTIRKTVEDKSLYYVAEISPENGKETVVLPKQERVVYSAAWLPDKTAMLLAVREPNADIRQIWQYFPDSQQWRRVTNDNNSYMHINLTRDGKSIVATQQSRLAAIWLSDGVPPEKNATEKKSPLIKPDNFRQITGGISNFDRLGWLSDGRLIYSATEDGKEAIFTINADGANARQITNGDDGIWISPSIAGNGQNISFLSSRAGAKQVWRIDADGKNLTKVTETSLSIGSARILRDNSTVIYLAQTKSGSILFRQTPNGETIQLTESDTGFWAISPSEKLLAAEVLDENTHKFRVEVRSLEDGKIAETFDFSAARQISFTPDGKNLAYDTRREDTSQIMLQPLDGGEPYILADFQTDVVFSFDWSPDGTRLAVIRGKQLNDAVLIKANNP